MPTPPDHPVPPPEAPSPWVITPQLLLSTTATDNAALTQTDRQADLQALINPSVTVTGDTQSAKVDLNYSPMILRNVVVTSGDIVDQNFFGTGTFVGVPDALFLNLRGSSSEGSRGGSMGPIDPIDLRSGDRTEVLAYDGGPEWRFPLVDAATGDLRYTFGQARFYDNTGAHRRRSAARHQPDHRFHGARPSPLSRQRRPLRSGLRASSRPTARAPASRPAKARTTAAS